MLATLRLVTAYVALPLQIMKMNIGPIEIYTKFEKLIYESLSLSYLFLKLCCEISSKAKAAAFIDANA